MAYIFTTTRAFDKAVKRCQRRGYPMEKLIAAIKLLVSEGTLPRQYLPHKLKGNYAGVWECHIAPDWLLLWKQDDERLTMLMVDTGTHADIF